MNEEIKELANILILNAEECKNNCGECKYDDDEIPCLAIIQAERLYNAGYRKTIWHKVADGDLPEESGRNFLVVLEWLGVLYYCTGVYLKSLNKWCLSNDANENAKVTAWTELPKYEGE